MNPYKLDEAAPADPAQADAQAPPAPQQPAQADAPSPLVKPGDQNDNVRHLQARLLELGYGPGAQDGNFGPVTQRALTRFQTDYGLKAHGKVDNATIEKLKSPAATGDPYRSEGDASAKDTKGSKQGKPKDDKQPDNKRGKDSESRGGVALAPRPGSKGATKKLHTVLDALGYDVGEKGEKQESAVKKMQKRYGLKPTGTMDRPTLKLVQRLATKAHKSASSLTLAEGLIPEDMPPLPTEFGYSPRTEPPALRDGEDWHECGTCVHFNGRNGCELYNYPVDDDDLCDSWFSLSAEFGLTPEDEPDVPDTDEPDMEEARAKVLSLVNLLEAAKDNTAIAAEVGNADMLVRARVEEMNARSAYRDFHLLEAGPFTESKHRRLRGRFTKKIGALAPGEHTHLGHGIHVRKRTESEVYDIELRHSNPGKQNELEEAEGADHAVEMALYARRHHTLKGARKPSVRGDNHVTVIEAIEEAETAADCPQCKAKIVSMVKKGMPREMAKKAAARMHAKHAKKVEEAAVPLEEAGFLHPVKFDPAKHPINRLGQFTEVLGRLSPHGGRAKLPDGTSVLRHGGQFRVHTRKGTEQVATFDTARAAAHVGLLAQTNHALSNFKHEAPKPGGWTKIKTGTAGGYTTRDRDGNTVKRGGRDIESTVSKNVFEVHPVLMDHGVLPKGTKVRITKLHGAPPPGTMGQYHVAHPETGKLLGMVSGNSLVPAREDPGTGGSLRWGAHDDWMVKSNLSRIRSGEASAKDTIATLRANGYPRHADAVEKAVAQEQGPHNLNLAGMKSGEEHEFELGRGGNSTRVKVRYDSDQSYGDNGKPVRGASTGRYTVTDSSGRSKTFEHGPFAETDAARKRGADPNSKFYAADKAKDHLVSLAPLPGRNDLNVGIPQPGQPAPMPEQRRNDLGNMKISDEKLGKLRSGIAPLDTPERRARYNAGDFPRADKVKDIDKRYRWDLLHDAGLSNSGLYDEGLNDTHIDTALRAIVPPLGRSQQRNDFSNADVIGGALRGEHHKAGSLTASKMGPNTTLVKTYNEPLAVINHATKEVKLNTHKYSVTSTRHQNAMHHAALAAGFTVTHTDRDTMLAAAGMPATPAPDVSGAANASVGGGSGSASGPFSGYVPWRGSNQVSAGAM